ncbi:hypothetical protein [Alienimonas sp. DA493]|uniref:hypothetical protein n=1 Tax=Alienimonas sp. DA493 TaxID=3373605 RepID=UPI003754783F
MGDDPHPPHRRDVRHGLPAAKEGRRLPAVPHPDEPAAGRGRRGRESVYAWGNRGHNTLSIGDAYHDPDGAGRLVGDAETFPAALDLTAALGDAVTTAVRTYSILDGDRGVEVTDEWTAAGEAFPTRARLHTEAAVEVDGLSAVLTRGGRRLRLTADGPEGTRLAAGPMARLISELDRPQETVTVIDVLVPTAAGESKTLVTRLELLD